jgi:hypothetical protein
VSGHCMAFRYGLGGVSSSQQYGHTVDSQALGSSGDRRNGSYAVFDLFSTPLLLLAGCGKGYRPDRASGVSRILPADL